LIRCSIRLTNTVVNAGVQTARPRVSQARESWTQSRIDKGFDCPAGDPAKASDHADGSNPPGETAGPDGRRKRLFGTDTFLSGYAGVADSYDFYSVRYIFAGAERMKPETPAHVV
jgi:hypothetical protein